MRMIGSSFVNFKDAYAFYLETEGLIVGQPNPNNKVHKVFKCINCGRPAWGSHTSKYCDECKDEQYEIYKARTYAKRAQLRAERKAKKLEIEPQDAYSRISWEEIAAANPLVEKAIKESDAVIQRKQAIAEWNERHCCPNFGSKGSIDCFYCMRGKVYGTAATNVSNRRCPNNPIATDGSRYIQRAAYRKDANGVVIPGSGKCYDVLDNMPQHLKVQLVERMQSLGRQFYIWSDGHVDITTEPDSDSELREVQSKED